MAIEQRVMVSPQREYETHDLPKQQPKIKRSQKDIFSRGEIPFCIIYGSPRSFRINDLTY